MAEYIDRGDLTIWLNKKSCEFSMNDVAPIGWTLSGLVNELATFPNADVVERKHLPEDVEELVTRLRSHNGWALNKTLDEAADAIEKLEKAVPRWVSVTERLPDNIDEEVLVCNEGYGKDGTGFATIAVYNGNGWLECWERKQYLACITHWMPLPEPPKEE